jgi:hypothetical protein
MAWSDSPRRSSVEQSIHILNRAIEKIDANDPVCAQVMVGVAIHLLETVRTDLNQHLDTERRIRQLLG